MTNYHLDDIEIEVDAAHADSPWVDVALSSGEDETYAPTSLILLSSAEARAFGRDLIAKADEAEEVAAAAEADADEPLQRTEFDTIHTALPMGSERENVRDRKLAERAEQLDRLGRQGWTLASAASGSDGRFLVLVDTLQRSRP